MLPTHSVLKNSNKTSRGFTLLELLVAIAIFALIAVGSYRLLSSTIAAREIGTKHEQKMRELQKAVVILQRDLLQVTDRPIRDEYGDVQPALYLPKENSIEFTHRGWRNPLGEVRSELQRVRYHAEAGQLVRERWQELDRARTSQPVKTILLDKVDGFQVRVFHQGKEESTWPMTSQIQLDKALLPLPDAVEVRFTLDDSTEIRRLVSLPALSRSQPKEGQ